MELSSICQNLLIALYDMHRDPKYPATRAYGSPGWLIAVHADMISDEEYPGEIIPGPSRMRSELIAAFQELENRDLVRRVAPDKRDHPLRLLIFDAILSERNLDYLEYFFQLTPAGIDCAARLTRPLHFRFTSALSDSVRTILIGAIGAALGSVLTILAQHLLGW